MIHPEAGPEAFLPDMMSPGSTEDPEESFCCVFCESGFEPLVVHALEYCGYGRALFPQRIKPVCRRGVWTDEKRALLPGYVFLRGEAPAYAVRAINHVIRLLRYEDGTVRLRGGDLDFARMLFQGNGEVQKLWAVRDGDYVRITDNLLKNANARVLRVEKRKHLAEVEILLAGTVNRVWLGLDILEPKSIE